jgi:hypothetical protein
MMHFYEYKIKIISDLARYEYDFTASHTHDFYNGVLL